MSTRDKNRNLYYLEELSDYKVADSDKDVRGWKVQDIDGKTIGEVDNLLVNKNSERVAYLNVKVDDSIISANHKPYSTKANEGVHDFINKEGENHIIIPIGMATLVLKNHIVSTTNINHQTFAQTKRFKSGSAIQREYEVDVFNSYTRPTTATIYPDDDSFYDRDEFKL